MFERPPWHHRLQSIQDRLWNPLDDLASRQPHADHLRVPRLFILMVGDGASTSAEVGEETGFEAWEGEAAERRVWAGVDPRGAGGEEERTLQPVWICGIVVAC